MASPPRSRRRMTRLWARTGTALAIPQYINHDEQTAMHCTKRHGNAPRGARTSTRTSASAKLLAAVAMTAALAGCSTWSDMSRTDKGTAIGAGAGAVVGGAAGRYVRREQDDKARREEAERNQKQKP